MAKTITLKVLSDTDTASSYQIEAIVQENTQQAQSSLVFTLPSLETVFTKAAQWKESIRQYIPIRREQSRSPSGVSRRRKQPPRFEEAKSGQAIASQHNKRSPRQDEDKSYQACDDSKRELFESFNYCLDNNNLTNWLQSTLESTIEPVRIIIQTDSIEVAALPWEQWKFWDDYYERNNLVIALSFLDQENSIPSAPPKPVASGLTRILVLLGDSISETNEINLSFDKEEFQKFEADLRKLGDRANAEIHIVKPNRARLEELLQEVWHIIYYGGHSKTLEVEKDGILYLEGQTQVKISELETILKQNLERGDLRLLVANACQGLGTALRLVLLGLPNVIVMRESIPDDVAHDFLRYLLESFIIGLPITSAIQHCKPHLRQVYDLRHQLPGASLLPVLCLTLDAMNEVDAPMIPLTGLHPICQEMRALANLAKARLTLGNAEDVAALQVQEYYADSLQKLKKYYADLLQLKNKVAREDATTEVSLEELFCSSPRLVGKLIWEVDFLATVQGQTTVWGQGFVNIKTGNSELLLDVRPWSWTGASAVLEQQEVKQLSLASDATMLDLNGEVQKASFTKKALLMLESAYREYALKLDQENRQTTQSYDHSKNAAEVKNFGGWLKDVNKKKFIKQLVIFQHQGISETEAQRQAYLKSPFGRARHELGITDFEVVLPRETFVPLIDVMQQDEWTHRDKEDLRQEGITDDFWSKLYVPRYIVISVARRA